MLLHGIVMDKWRSVSSAPLSSGLSFGNHLATGGRRLRVMRPTRAAAHHLEAHGPWRHGLTVLARRSLRRG
jgi:hypothetical protein